MDRSLTFYMPSGSFGWCGCPQFRTQLVAYLPFSCSTLEKMVRILTLKLWRPNFTCWLSARMESYEMELLSAMIVVRRLDESNATHTSTCNESDVNLLGGEWWEFRVSTRVFQRRIKSVLPPLPLRCRGVVGNSYRICLVSGKLLKLY